MTGAVPPRRNDPCPCGSGKRFKRCCGRSGAVAPAPASTDPARVPPFLDTPDELLIVRDFLSREQCSELVELTQRLRSEEAEISMARDGEEGLLRRRSARRITTTIKTFEHPDAFATVVARGLREHVEPRYGVRIEWFEWPDVLLYRPGGHYELHTDADLRDPGTGAWRRVMDRDFSLLVYLNDDFTGGNLELPDRGETIRPEAGMLVAFPSDHRFSHAALPVESGNRYVIVSWAAALGSPRVLSGPRLKAVYPDPSVIPGDLPIRNIEGAGAFIDGPAPD